MAGEAAHYFDEDPAADSEPRLVDLVLPDLTTTLQSDRGVFSADHVDPGTRYLLLEAPTPDPHVATALDLGCGYGPIARTLVHRAPEAHVWAVDVNQRARRLAAKNLAGLPATVAAPDDVPEDVSFDLIWSNPPIRIGKAALRELLERWLARLTPTGSAVLVVQKHLGADSLARWLNEQGYATTRLGSRRGYRLLEVRARAA
jgi:16S rRNA (guanine1207-N2)-methyltransferase